MDEHLVKPALVRAVGRFVPKMPFAKNAGSIARRLEHLRKRCDLEGETFPFEDGMSDTVLELVPACEKGATGRRTGGADVIVSKADAFVVQTVDVGCSEDWVSVTGHVAIALVVCENEDDVR